MVTSVNPGPIATNFFTIADEKGTYVKNVQRYMLQPEYVAQKVVDSMLTKTREINLPRWMNMGSVVYVLFPRLFERIGKSAFNQKIIDIALLAAAVYYGFLIQIISPAKNSYTISFTASYKSVAGCSLFYLNNLHS